MRSSKVSIDPDSEPLPVLAISNDELASAPELGETVACHICGGEHPVEHAYGTKSDGSRSDLCLSVFKCGNKSYMCGLNNKELRPRG